MMLRSSSQLCIIRKIPDQGGLLVDSIPCEVIVFFSQEKVCNVLLPQRTKALKSRLEMSDSNKITSKSTPEVLPNNNLAV